VNPDGRLEQVGDRWRLRFVCKLPHRPEKVWRALTEPEQLAAWFPAEMHGERTAGAPLQFVHKDFDGAPKDGEMIIYDPPSVLEFRWTDDTFCIELEPDGDGCVLTFEQTFDELGKAARDGAGWHVCLDVLGYHLSGEKAPWEPMDRWPEVNAAYRRRLGPDASTIGPPKDHPVTQRSD
jgi:uncharacterized protein YndB with AHSA1/START domain